jgi:transposase
MQVTRGMRRRSEKQARRRERLPADALIAGVDLAKKESIVVFVRASDRARVGKLQVSTDRAGIERLIARARELVAEQGTGALVIAMEPTSHFWKPVARAAETLGIGYVLVQGFVVAHARELDDLTRDKTDSRDATLIADLAAELRFTETRLSAGPWAGLELLVTARDARRLERAAALQEMRALLELTWPGLLEACPALTGSHLQAMLRMGLTPQAVVALPRRRFEARLRRHHPRRFLGWMAGRLWAAARDVPELPETPAAAMRWRLAAERVALADVAIAELDARMLELLEATGYGWLRGQLRGLGDQTLAAILALTGDPAGYDDARCLVKLAGTNPTERSSGEREAAGGIHRRGHPLLRYVSYLAAVNLVRHEPEFRARFHALTARERTNRLTAKQAYVALANKLLRTLWSMAVSGRGYEPAIARGEVRPLPHAA